MNFFDIFQYGFMVRGLEAGIIVGLIAPLIGIFLVLRRYSLFADTLAHVSLAGVALGFFLNVNPILTAVGVTVASSFGIERLRSAKRIAGESALALFLSGSLAVATVLLSLGKGFNANLFNYLFGSILTVTETDIYIMATLGAVVLITIVALYKELVAISFDEDSAHVSGIPVQRINTALIVLSALTVSLSIPVVGILLIAALLVIPTLAALQLRTSFVRTILYAECISLFSIVTGIVASFYLDLSTGGTIVIIMLLVFFAILSATRR